MKKHLYMNFLLGIAIALITLDETQVSCGIIVVQSSSSSSSSSGFGTWCNGLHCSPHSNCMAFTTIINGNATSDKRCTNMYGEIERQETVTIRNGEMCIRNLTRVGKKVNVQRSCRKLSKAELDNMKREEKDHQIQEAVQDELERQQDALEDALEQQQDALEREQDALKDAMEQEQDALEWEQDALEDALEREEQHREWWREQLERDREQKIEAREQAWRRQADALQKRLQQEAEARKKFLEMQRLQMEEAAYARQDKIHKTLNALNSDTTVRQARWGV